jgi:glycerol dehydrogenase-like iron-containing ADH family enzyme
MKQLNLIKDSKADASGSFMFPGRVIKGEGTINGAGAFLDDRAAVLAGPYVMKNFVPGIKGARAPLQVTFKGECSPGEFFRVKNIILENRIKTLAAAGGGKTLDIAKYLKREIKGLRLIAIPTSAATCAAYTPVTVLYDEAGVYMDTLDTVCPDIIVIDYDIFYGLPMPFFAAGAADTLAKYYEAAVYKKFHKNTSSYDNFVFAVAEEVYKRLKQMIRKKWKNPGKEEKRALTDINIIYSGMISCVGKYTVTSSLAHALAHALTAVPCAREFLHGEHVGVSLLAQEELLKNKRHLSEISDLLGIMDMPDGLPGLGITKAGVEKVYGLYRRIKIREKIYLPVKDDLLYNILNGGGKPRFNGRSIAVSAVKNGFIDSDRF